MFEVATTIIRFAIPVASAAAGETVGQKAGVLNIGLEGTLLAAAYVSAITGLATQNVWIAFLAGVFAALVVTGIQAVFTLRMGVDMVVIGTVINLLVQGVTSTLYRAQFGGSGQLLSVPRLPSFGGIDVIVVAVAVLTGFLGWAIMKTNWGLAVRAAGEYPPALVASGFSAHRVRFSAVLVGGLMAGIGGAYLTLGVTGSFSENVVAGRGFLALAMVTFGRWKPWLVVAAACFVGLADWAQFALQASMTGIPSQLLRSLPYLLALATLVIFGTGTKPPASLGEPLESK